MRRRAPDGAPLEELVRRSVSVGQQAERACPRRGPGRKPTIPDWVLAVMIMIGVMLKKKTKAAQLVWWRQHHADFERWMPGQTMPSRSTFYDRYRRAHRLFRQAIILQGHAAVQRGWAQPECVAIDKKEFDRRSRTDLAGPGSSAGACTASRGYRNHVGRLGLRWLGSRLCLRGRGHGAAPWCRLAFGGVRRYCEPLGTEDNFGKDSGSAASDQVYLGGCGLRQQRGRRDGGVARRPPHGSPLCVP